MRNLSAMVWTKKGMAKVIEHKRDNPNVRVQYFKDDSQEDVPLAEAANFFTAIELKQDTLQQDTKSPTARVVTFEIDMSANYAI